MKRQFLSVKIQVHYFSRDEHLSLTASEGFINHCTETTLKGRGKEREGDINYTT